MKHIRVITPALESDEFKPMVDGILKYKKSDLEITHTYIDKGPTCLENDIDDAASVPYTLLKALAAEKEEEKVDGLLINCMCDPGLNAVREAVSIPVVGTNHVAMHMAAILGHSIGFIDILEDTRTLTLDQAARYGIGSRLVSFRHIDMPVLELEKDPEDTVKRLIEAGLKSVTEDHADVLILGCGAMLGCAEKMQAAFKEKLGQYIPIIDPVPMAIKTLVSITENNLCHSKKAYPLPGKRSMDDFAKVYST